jgi:hypothetical protein
VREKERIERILTLIRQIWEKQPDTRFNQLIINLSWGFAHKDKKNKKYIKSGYSHLDSVVFDKDIAFVDLFYLEDDIFENFLKEYLHSL